MDNLFSLKGKNAVVTGGGSGIGQTIAMALAQAEANVAIIGRREAPLQKTVALMQQTHPAARVFAHSFDITALDKIPSLVEIIHQNMPTIDILVNNAGANPRLPIEQITPAIWQQTIDVNLSAAFFMAQAIVPDMKKQGWGRILNLASLQSTLAFRNGAAYGAGKSGVAQLTRAMAREWSCYGINANAIAPGFFPTDLTAPVFEDPASAQQLANRTAIGRNGKLEELAGAVLLLCSPASSYITGQVLPIDGGWTAV